MASQSPTHPSTNRRGFLRALGAFFAVTSANCSAAVHAPACPASRVHHARYLLGSDAYSPVVLTDSTLNGGAAQIFHAQIHPPSTDNPFFNQRFRAEYQALVSTVGHPPSFAFGLRSPRTLNTELMAGWYLGAKQRYYGFWGRGSNVRAAFRSFFDMGDTNFDQPGHHGTHAERLTAIMRGVQLSYATGADFRTALGPRRGLSVLTDACHRRGDACVAPTDVV